MNDGRELHWSAGVSRWFFFFSLSGVIALLLLSGCGSSADVSKAEAQVTGTSSPSLAPATQPMAGPEESRRPARLDDSVSRVYGNAVVREGSFDAQSLHRPWSGYWYPKIQKTLFEREDGQPSPLEKYDAYVRKVHGRDGGAAEYERQDFELHRTPDGLSFSPWEGLCDAWSEASVTEVEPSKCAVIDGVRFDVGDLKALLIKSYERVEGIQQFGKRYYGRRGDDYLDIYPDQFHRLLQAELFERGRPLVMDRDPSFAVWNYPVMQASTRLERDASDPAVFHVRTLVSYASPDVKVDFVGTKVVWGDEYTYDLYGLPRPDGSFEVLSGAWTGNSLDVHPDFLTVVPDSKPVRSSENPNLDPVIVDEILVKALSSPGC